MCRTPRCGGMFDFTWRCGLHRHLRRPPHRPAGQAGVLRAPALGHRELLALGAGCRLRRGPLPGPQRQRTRVMATLRNTAISLLRLAGRTDIAAVLRHHVRNPHRPVTFLLNYDFAGALAQAPWKPRCDSVQCGLPPVIHSIRYRYIGSPQTIPIKTVP